MAKAFTSKEINEGIITDSAVREKLAEHIEVLDRAGKLLTMPKVNMATTEQVAEFFNVPSETIRTVYKRNKEELAGDGVRSWTVSEIKIQMGHDGLFESVGQSGYTGLLLDDGSTYKLPTRGIRLFPKRAVLRIAMLLTGSEVAKAVRTALLNLTEKVTEKAPQIIDEINREMVAEKGETLMLMAHLFAGGDMTGFIEQTMTMNKWFTGKIVEARTAVRELTSANQALGETNEALGQENKYLSEANESLGQENKYLSEANESLGTVNRMLLKEELPWKPRTALVAIIRACNMARGLATNKMNLTYDEFYRTLAYREAIDVKKRKVDGIRGKQIDDRASLVSLIREDEWPRVMKALCLYASEYCVDPWYVTNDATVEKYHLDSCTYDGKTYTATKTRVWKDVAQKTA